MTNAAALLILVCTVSVGSGIRILAIFPTPSYSHQIVFQTYIGELAKEGYDVSLISPTFSNIPNITEYNVKESHEMFNLLLNRSRKFHKRGIISDVTSVTRSNYRGLLYLLQQQFQLPVVQKLLANKNNDTYDLIITEAFFNYPLAFSHVYKAPVIQFSSGYGVAENFETLGAVSRHPKYFPNMWRSKYRHLSHSESVDELYTEFRLYNEFKGLANDEYDMMQKQFGSDLPDMNTLKRNVQMLFVNVPAIFDNNRPVPPNIQYLGGLHLARPMNTELSYPIKSYLDKCVRGVIYVSFGSAIKTSDIGTEFLNVFIDTFRALPYDILWNTNINISNLPNNVHTHNWLPQRELLHHRNVVGFVTQGGVQSTDESIDALVPLIGVPMMGDQFFNTNRYIELGIGTAVDSLKVTSQKLTDAILSVVHNATILSNLKRLYDVINDQPMKPLQKAIYWTKYILKHRFDSMLVTSTAYKEFYTSCLGSYGNNLFKECE